MKLQETYAMEQNKVGTWAEIGYKSPGAGATDSSTTNFGYTQGDAGTWIATSKAALNDCKMGSTWNVTTTYTTSTGNLKTAASGDVTNCITPLTPNFCAIATDGKCTTSEG